MPVRKHSGFTLVEILIVVVILGILAAIVVPQFTSASEASRESAVRMDLHRLRTQLELFKEQHHNSYPSMANFADLLTLSSDADGNTAPRGTPGYPYGPYIMQMPRNSFTSGDTVGNGAAGTSDWYYDETTGELRANHDADARTW